MQRVGVSWWARVAREVLGRPELWVTAVTQVRRLAPTRWWRRWPFLPLPDPGYLRFRLETQYGNDGVPDPADVVTYLHWCRTFRASR